MDAGNRIAGQFPEGLSTGDSSAWIKGAAAVTDLLPEYSYVTITELLKGQQR